MLVLSRKVGEKIVIGDNITVVVNRVSGNRVSVGIEAPANVRIVRGEIANVATEFDRTASDETAVGEQGPEQRKPSQAVTIPLFDFGAGPVIHRAR